MADKNINFTINLDGNIYKGIAQIDAALNKVNLTGKQTKRVFDRINDAAFAVNNLFQATQNTIGKLYSSLEKVVSVGSEGELQKMNLTTLFQGNAEAAEDMYQKIAKYGKETPYDKAGLIDAQKTMMSFGISGEKSFKVLQQIGDIAMGDKQKMQSLTLAFSQMSSTGKLMGQDLLQMINAGFNPLNEISRMTGKSISVLKDEMSKGQISADMVAQAFAHATSEGGLFYQAIDKAAGTTAGKIASFQDTINETLFGIFEKIKPYVDSVLDIAISAVDQVLPVLSAVTTRITAIFNAIRRAVLVVQEWSSVIVPLMVAIGALTIACNINRISLLLQEMQLYRLIIQEKLATIATHLWSGAQAILNAVMSANPIGLVIAAIAALIAIIAAIILKYEEWGATLSLLLGPLGMIINLVQSLRRHWDSIKAAFQDGGILSGLKRIGQVFLDALLMPVQQLLELASQIPGVGNLAAKGAEKIEDLRKRMNLIVPEPIEKATSPFAQAAMGTNNALQAAVSSTNAHNSQSGIGTQTTKSTEAVATGGTRSTHVTINLKDLVGSMHFNGTLTEKKEEMERTMAEVMFRVLNMAQSSIS
ncbi:MAG: tape measure protein [Paludibacter sp.]|nr:tape measure protein [Bacteroidales bacterium]MCM1069827.1 tape measure protein [Prevotella sp.]MCM1353979.1 tape measure protein [Bacteroides sp.]MCM1443379.1 tape measure protein [Muribaculum sp.]MCM1482082.1 tape measure protein [Paludibacter sp.]